MNEDLMKAASRVSPLLQQPLDHDNPETLEEQLSQCEAHVYEFIRLKRQFYQDARKTKSQYLAPKQGKETDLDRKTHLDAVIAPIEADYDFCCDVIEQIYKRIGLGQSLLSNRREEAKRLLR